MTTVFQKLKSRIGFLLSPFTDSFLLWRNFHKAYFRPFINFARTEISFDGEPKPWFNYPAIEFLDSIDLKGMEVFEWGCGNSTLYFNSRGAKTFSIEHIPSWANEIQSKIDGNIMIAEASEMYVNALKNSRKSWDIILVDGEYRSSCAGSFIEYLANWECRMLILDNANWFPLTAKFLCQRTKWIPLFISGFGPLVTYPTQTLFLINPKFGIKIKDAPKIPLGSNQWSHPDDFKMN